MNLAWNFLFTPKNGISTVLELRLNVNNNNWNHNIACTLRHDKMENRYVAILKVFRSETPEIFRFCKYRVFEALTLKY